MKQEIKDLLGGISSIRQIKKPFTLNNSVVKKNNLFEVKIQDGKITMPLFATVYTKEILEYIVQEMPKDSLVTSIMLADVTLLLEFDDVKISYKKLTKFKTIIEDGFKTDELTGINDDGTHYVLTKGLIAKNNYSEVLFCVYVTMDAATIAAGFVNNDLESMNPDAYEATYSAYLSREFFNSKLDKYMKVIKESLLEPFIADNDIELFMNKNQMIYNIADLVDFETALEVTPEDVINELMSEEPIMDVVEEPTVTIVDEPVVSPVSFGADEFDTMFADVSPQPIPVESHAASPATDDRPF